MTAARTLLVALAASLGGGHALVAERASLPLARCRPPPLAARSPLGAPRARVALLDGRELHVPPGIGLSHFSAVTLALPALSVGKTAAWIFGTIAAGMASGVVSKWLMQPDTWHWYDGLTKPRWQPPASAFARVWAVLYALLGYSAALVAASAPSPARTSAMWFYAASITLQFAWAPLFFGTRKLRLAANWNVLLLVMAVANARAFGEVEPLAGRLFVPYVAWIGFATALTFALDRLNRRRRLPPGEDERDGA
ncbi:hypothetical protein KFE25_014265 [Diacronema lutheri]|uniref:Peripheral-type benzodiazepine receptor n=1 Tax=Diacronema lutheri TaxID=2081491 RepID=A0A8J5XK34_DIALT|nr:hypothetical protein KFE25_014265 [Diacronema lutheri]